MQRREFLGGLLAVTATSIVEAQGADRVYRIGIVSPSAPISQMTETGNFPSFVPFFTELRRLGYIEGKNLEVLRFSAGADPARFDATVGDAVHAAPELVVSVGNAMTMRLKTTVPIIPVVAAMSDPVANRLVASLSRPGANITGVASDAGAGVWGKRLAMLREVVPGAPCFGILVSESIWDSAQGAAAREAAQQLAITLVGSRLRGAMNEAEYRRVFGTIVEQNAAGLLVSEISENFVQRGLIVDLVTRAKLPAIYCYREFVEAGGLMAYTYDIGDIWRRMANYVDLVLKGTKPNDLPIYQPTKFDTIVNLKTANAMGLTLPPTLMAQADEVIE